MHVNSEFLFALAFFAGVWLRQIQLPDDAQYMHVPDTCPSQGRSHASHWRAERAG